MQRFGVYYLLICTMVVACNLKTPPVNKTLKVKEIEFEGVADFQDVSRLLDEQVETHFVDVLNWDDFPYQPKVGFKIAHSNNQIWLKYEVEEENIFSGKDRIKQLCVQGQLC